MITKNKFLSWLFISLFIFAACSDDKDPVIPPGPGPDPDPDPELAEGITLTPASLDDTAEAKITFKAPKSSALYGYTGDVYAHIGVVEGTDWLYVPADWDENISKCKMTKEAENAWSLTLSSSIRSWFGVTNGMPVQKIGLVVRSSDGKKQESDAFITVTDNTFKPAATENASMPSGMQEGINIVSTSTVTLVLYDKDTKGNHKDYAYVIGDFNDWTINNAYQMKRDEAAGCWWLTLSGLNGQTEYAFQYYIGTKADGNIRLADAYTEKVIDPMDVYIPASIYPGLRGYPSSKTAGIISTFKTQPDAYNWQSADFKVEDKNNLVIYEMLFRDFTSEGSVNAALAKLDHIREMGANAVELMPVQEFDGNESWGYNPCFYFAMDKAYGTKNDYKKFIDACHSKGMAVILDVVYNHATGSNPFAKLYWDAAKNKTASNNPWFNVDAPHPHSVFHDFNHESGLVQTFVKRNLQFLLEEYKIDGFRFDLTKGFTQKKSSDDAGASAYDQTRIDILKGYNDAIMKVNQDAVVILEHFAVEAEEKVLAEAGMQLWRNRNHAYCQSAMGYSSESAFTGLTNFGTTMPFGGWVGYMESHDEERAAYKQTAYATGALKTDLATRMHQLEVNASLFFTVPGPKMIWQFGELGYDITLDADGDKTGPKPVLWNYKDVAERKGLYDTYSKLIALRTSHKSLFQQAATMNWRVGVSDWNAGRYVSLKSLTGEGLVAVGNFTSQTITCQVNFQQTGTWTDYINGGDDLTIAQETQPISVPAHSFCVYVKK
ncbi:alpha-amylase family glycosyl hydrolase [Bacteroides sp. 51]|uniref:alpha-amylase family glycosyl hydrolase n=1 Tax=Bacteroides sp. 51 TaxID=2302938 RepID=UPI001EF32996|nr:alpha-amylase family glycosyl hydrolase [Bacteroides sp. 51]NDV82854.1 alpha-amylase [Bacteroides sp. 51]